MGSFLNNKIIDAVELTSYSEDLILRRLTTNKSVPINMADASIQSGANSTYGLFATGGPIPLVGAQSTNFPNMYCVGNTVTPWPSTNGPANNQFSCTSNWEGSTGKASWTSNGVLTQEVVRTDWNNNPTIVPTPPLTSDGQIDTKIQNIPKVVQIPRWLGQPYRKLTFYVANPKGLPIGVYAYEQQLNQLLASTNFLSWGIPSAGADLPRTWMICAINITTNNSVLFRIEITFVYRAKTWDEIGLWLDSYGNVSLMANNKVPNLDPPIPPFGQAFNNRGGSFPGSNVGFGIDTVGLTGAPTPARGWARFITAHPLGWHTLFNQYSNKIPDLSKLGKIFDPGNN